MEDRALRDAMLKAVRKHPIKDLREKLGYTPKDEIDDERVYKEFVDFALEQEALKAEQYADRVIQAGIEAGLLVVRKKSFFPR